jgi:hypothetical protein
MNEPWNSILVALIPALSVAVLTAWLTVRLSLRQHYSQHRWERKLRAYEEIFVALHNMKRYSETYVEAYERDRDFNEVEDRLIEPRREAQTVLARTVDIGQLVVSPEAVLVLQSLQSALREALKEHDSYSMASEEVVALNKALAELHDVSKRDLGK